MVKQTNTQCPGLRSRFMYCRVVVYAFSSIEVVPINTLLLFITW